MNVSALLTSAGINTAVSVGVFFLYSVLRKQPSLVSVYFGQRLAQVRSKRHNPFCFDRFVPSPSWILKAWEASDEEIFAAGGLDAMVFVRLIIFSIRTFSIAAIVCIFLVLPLNYFGQEMHHKIIPAESMAVFSIDNVRKGSKWLWAHCTALYVITCCTCVLLYFEYKRIAKLRLAYITDSLSSPSHFTMLVRAVPWSKELSYNDVVANFFMNYYASSYLSHQMVYRSGTVQKLINDAEKMYKMLKHIPEKQHCGPHLLRCGLCGGSATSFKMLPSHNAIHKKSDFGESELRNKECAAALVFFRTRYAALVASQSLQSPNPMLWVTDRAPAPQDIHWANLCVPHRILWIRRVAILVASIVFVVFFLVPVAFSQGLVHVEKLQRAFPFMKDILKRKFMVQLISGYLPSVILMLFLYIVPPIMFVFSTLEGPISRSDRKKSACIKVLYFMIWNVFMVNILTGNVLDHYNPIDGLGTLGLSPPKDIPTQLANFVSSMATFFMTYVMTSGWASLSFELMQPFGLACNFFYRFILRNKDESTYGTLTFPYQTEVPRALLLGLLGFVYCILAPMLLPFLLVYFILAFFVYRNQILNVYVTKYETGGLYWPIVHQTTIFSLVLTQVIALGVFGLKESPTASSSTIPLIICTLLFNEYCRQRFHPVFKCIPAQLLIEMDREDEQNGKMQEIHQKLPTAYCQFTSASLTLGNPIPHNAAPGGNMDHLEDMENIVQGLKF